MGTPTARRVIGTETEYGVYDPEDSYANPIHLSTEAVRTWGAHYRGALGPVGWDYRAEDPLNDIRGMRLDRAMVDPSLLTDDPYHLAPTGGSEALPAPTEEQMRLPRPTSIVLTNGARFYVDHAHPEYSAPETSNARAAVLWDLAGDEIARRVMDMRAKAGLSPIVLVKNNVDGKGATYGSHENYQVKRSADLDDLIRFSIPFLVTRQIFCGAGRVGLGQKSERAGFQISQRADYVENDIGLETTFNRPIFNTRDEPHSNHHYWRRVHVIGGDANQFHDSMFLRLGTTALVLRALEQDTNMEWETLDLDNPIEAVKEISQDLTLKRELHMRSGGPSTALAIQRRYIHLVTQALQGDLNNTENEVLERWADVLDRMEKDLFSVAAEVEWVGKYALLKRQKDRLGTNWDDARLVAMDLQWGDLRPEKSLVVALERAGMVSRMFTQDQIDWAVDNPPQDTRAKARGDAVSRDSGLRQASWTSLVREDQGAWVRIPLADPTDPLGSVASGDATAMK